VLLPTTLSDLEGHSSYWKPFKTCYLGKYNAYKLGFVYRKIRNYTWCDSYVSCFGYKVITCMHSHSTKHVRSNWLTQRTVGQTLFQVVHHLKQLLIIHSTAAPWPPIARRSCNSQTTYIATSPSYKPLSLWRQNLTACSKNLHRANTIYHCNDKV